MRLPLHVSVHIYDYFQGDREQYFMQLLSWIPLKYFVVWLYSMQPYVITVGLYVYVCLELLPGWDLVIDFVTKSPTSTEFILVTS
jgi:hypothetical protein